MIDVRGGGGGGAAPVTSVFGRVGVVTAIAADYAAFYLADIVDDTTPQLGGNLDTNDYYIEIDSAPGSDHEVNGTVSTLYAGENLVFGDFCYFKSDGKLWKADADAASTMKVIAMAAATINADANGIFLLQGFARDDSWTWTVGSLPGTSDIFASTTAGGATQTAPSGTGDQVQVIGWAGHADRMYFNPSGDVVEIV